MSRVLVTGAAGFIGSAVVRHLEASSVDVVPAARAQHGVTHQRAGVAVDILDRETLLPALQRVDVVVHAAGLAHQFGGRASSASFQDVNAQGTTNVASVAATCGVRRLVLLSSVAVYGAHDRTIVNEDVPCRPLTPYASSKLEAESRATEVAQGSGMELIILRLATVYGEGDRGNVARLMRAIDRGWFVWLGEGSNRKSLIHCDDVARACLAAINGREQGVYNVTGAVTTMRQIVEGICSSLGRRVPRWRVPASPVLALASAMAPLTRGSAAAARLTGAVEKWLADDAYDDVRFRSAFRFASAVAIEDGLKRQARSYRTSMNS